MTKEEAVDMGIEALKQIIAIESIIDVSNTIIQEDVLKYKMIVDVVKGNKVVLLRRKSNEID